MNAEFTELASYVKFVYFLGLEQNRKLKSQIHLLRQKLEKTKNCIKKIKLKQEALKEFFFKKDNAIYNELGLTKSILKKVKAYAAELEDKDKASKEEDIKQHKHIEILKTEVENLILEHISHVESCNNRAKDVMVSNLDYYNKLLYKCNIFSTESVSAN